MTVPRDNEIGPEAFEQVLASLHSIRNLEAGFQIQSHTDFVEIVCFAKSELFPVIESRIRANHPDCQFSKSTLIAESQHCGAINPREIVLLPFKRYPQFESQGEHRHMAPVSALFGAVASHHGTFIRVEFRPLDSGWNQIAHSILEHLYSSEINAQPWYRLALVWAALSPSRAQRLTRKPFYFLLRLLDPSRFPSNRHIAANEHQTTGRHERESVSASIFDKINRPQFSVSLVVGTTEVKRSKAVFQIRDVAAAFQVFAQPQMNSFALARPITMFHPALSRKRCVLSTEELATIIHLPTQSVSIPKIRWMESREFEPPQELDGQPNPVATVIGKLRFRNSTTQVTINNEDRRRHFYILGKTGMGKSTLLQNMLVHDVKSGRGIGLVDPHGDLAESVLAMIPKNRSNDVILFDPGDNEFPIAFNILENFHAMEPSLIASGVVSVFKKLNSDSWGPRLEHFLRNSLLTLVSAENTTLLGLQRILVDDEYREKIVRQIEDPLLRKFWHTEFDVLPAGKRAEVISPIQNKVGQFLSAPIVRNTLGQVKSRFNFRSAMDQQKIVIVNLSKGRLGEDYSNFLGALLVTKIQLDAMSRADIPENERKDFFVYVDEFQNFATESFATILSEARKYRLSLILANQYLDQLIPEIESAVFGNVGSILSFQIGTKDAEKLSKEFGHPNLRPSDLTNLAKYNAICRIMKNGQTSPAFSISTLPPPIRRSNSKECDKMRNMSRTRYCTSRSKVEHAIQRWSRQ